MSLTISQDYQVGTTLATRQILQSNVHAPVVQPMGYDPQDDMLKVKSVQKKFRDSFPGAALDTTKWDTANVGTPGTITVSGGTITIGSGVAINSETGILSKETFTVPFRVSASFTLSQRIVNQSFILEAVSVNPSTNIPDGQHSIAFVFDGVTATLGKYRVQNSGLTPLDSAAVTLPTTASGSVYELEPFADEAWFHGSVLDATSGRSNSYRRHQQIPDPNALYKIRARWLNGATAPASNTNAVVQFVACQDYAELTAEITAGRGQVVAGQALGVAVVSMPTTTVVAAAGSAAIGTVGPTAPATAYFLNSAAGTNGVLITAGTSGVQAFFASNVGATDAFVKLYNKATAPVVGTDVPEMIIAVPAGGQVELTPGFAGYRFALGLGIAITGAAADTDTTAVAAGQVKVKLSRTV